MSIWDPYIRPDQPDPYAAARKRLREGAAIDPSRALRKGAETIRKEQDGETGARPRDTGSESRPTTEG